MNIVGIVSFFCKDMLFFRKMQEIFEKMFESEEDNKKYPPLVW